MAIFITILVLLLLFGITFIVYACVVVGKRSKTPKEVEYEKQEEIDYINNTDKVSFLKDNKSI